MFFIFCFSIFSPDVGGMSSFRVTPDGSSQGPNVECVTILLLFLLVTVNVDDAVDVVVATVVATVVVVVDVAACLY